ncbi:MAG TPA: class I adenylate-forming enzyme family protein [Acidimicrobiia bacterium]|nr:class I adenylate-forming enzyme family protein [Acidimicrobiia bacterium]
MNIAMILEMAADALGDRLAYGTRAEGLSYEDLRSAARGIADRVDGSGAQRLALLEANAPIVPATLFGAAWAGVSYAPLNYRLPEAQLEALLSRIEPAVVSAPHWLDNKGTGDRAFPDSPDAPAVLLFTSGTSAEPKAAILEHDQLLAYIFNTLEFGSAGEDEAAIVVVPPFHVAGVAAVLSNTYVGRRIVPVPGVRFSAEDWLVTARDEQITHAMLVPTMLGKIVEAMEADESLRVPTLRAMSYGGSRMPPPILERALHLFPEVDFVNAYGLTETSSTVAILGPDDHRLALYSDEPLFKARLSSVGQPVPGIEFRIVDESGASLGPDEPGEILIRGDQVSGKYVGTDSKVDAEGWLHTGDRGWLDVEGYVFCEGRADDTIIRGGENIGPAEVEDALLQHDAISVAAVVGLADEQYGEKIASMISLRAGVDDVDLDHVREWVRERIGSLKTPEIIVVVDEVPQTATGKILRREVKRLLEDG